MSSDTLTGIVTWGGIIGVTALASLLSFQRLRGGLAGCALVNAAVITLALAAAAVADGFFTPFWPIAVVYLSQYVLATYWLTWLIYGILLKKGPPRVARKAEDITHPHPQDRNENDPY